MIYEIERKSGVGDWVPLVSLVDTFAYDDVGLDFGTYSYRIRAISGALVSSWQTLSSVEVLDIITDWHFIAEGDSIVASGGLPPPEPVSHARLLPDEYTPEPGVDIKAIAGTNMTDMIARQAAVIAIIEAHVPSQELVITSIQMGNGLIEMSPLELYEAYLQYCDDIRAVDTISVIVVCDTLYRNNETFAPGWAAGNGLVVTTFNDLLRLDPSRFDEHVKWSDNEFGQFDAASDIDLYSDGIHPTQALYDMMVPVEKQVFDRLLSGQRPICNTLPSITGLYAINQTLTADPGLWSMDVTFTYQWLRSDVNIWRPIVDATVSTYVTASLDVGKRVKCNVAGTHMGITVYRASNFSDVIITFYGLEIVVNNRLGQNNATGWTPDGGGTVDALTGKLRLTQPGGQTNARVKQTVQVPTVAGQTYQFDVDFTLGVNAAAGRTLIMSTEGGTVLAQIDYTTSGHYTINFTATASSTYIDFRDPLLAIAGTTWFWDNISIRHISSNQYEEFMDEDYTPSTYTVVGPGVSAIAGPGNGPGGISQEYTLTIPAEGYLYKPFNVGSIFNSDVGDTALVKIWVLGTAGQKIALRQSDTAPADFVLHTFSGAWEKIELRRTAFNGLDGLLGFENRAGVATGAGVDSPTFKVWGISYRF
jgi:hypothetical protein